MAGQHDGEAAIVVEMGRRGDRTCVKLVTLLRARLDTTDMSPANNSQKDVTCKTGSEGELNRVTLLFKEARLISSAATSWPKMRLSYLLGRLPQTYDRPSSGRGCHRQTRQLQEFNPKPLLFRGIRLGMHSHNFLANMTQDPLLYPTTRSWF